LYGLCGGLVDLRMVGRTCRVLNTAHSAPL
jgi:hypothetical protein